LPGADARSSRYAAAIARDVAQRSALQTLKRKFFGGSTELLLTRLIADRQLSAADIERIERILEAQPEGRNKK
jgi:predicted transcriptional regulator